jgi:hypothetical protein
LRGSRFQPSRRINVHAFGGAERAYEFPARSALPDAPLRVRRHAPSEKWQAKGDKIAQWNVASVLAFDSNARLNFGRVFEIIRGQRRSICLPLAATSRAPGASGPPSGAGGFSFLDWFRSSKPQRPRACTVERRGRRHGSKNPAAANSSTMQCMRLRGSY